MSDSIPHARITVSVAAGVASVEIDNPSQLDALTKASGNYSAQGEIAWGFELFSYSNFLFRLWVNPFSVA